MEQLYSLVHREHGAISTFTTSEEAERELERVLDDEPAWADLLRVEPFELIVDETTDR